MRTVTLELLRHGPAHNQLLSPLTPYLALCENHAPVTITIPFEHNQFLHRLSALNYEFGLTPGADQQRQFQLSDTGRELGKLLATIPGLMAELSRHRDRQNEVIHLRMILSASELALLPFELVLSGNGLPGSGQALLLQNQTPLCLTREVRRVKESALPWSRSARVLFASAAPAGLTQPPVDAHLLALRHAVDPWLGYFKDGDDEERRRQVDQCLHFLPDATIEDIQAACSSGEFTHVHILAHGLARQDGFDLRFGIALHDAADRSGEPDIVSGERLASALRPVARPGRDAIARPMVVTLASCNGANGGSVVGAGASVAHALQVAGIPLVVAGQFPLTFEGSLELVETLYEGLLWGTDPRSLLLDLRRRMHVLQPRSHDWASLTAYASLPADFDDQLCDLVIGRARAAIDAAMNYADRTVSEIYQRKAARDAGDATTVIDPTSAGSKDDWAKGAAEQARARIQRPWAVLERLVHRMPERKVELTGILASLAKRRAEIELATSLLVDRNDKGDTPKRLLQESAHYYDQCFRASAENSWAAVQYLSLSLLLELPHEGMNQELDEAAPYSAKRSKELSRLRRLCFLLSNEHLSSDETRRGYALGNLVELQLISSLVNMSHDQWDELRLQRAREWARQLIARSSTFQIYSTRRQLSRYALWFPLVNPRFKKVAQMAAALIDDFPDESKVLDDHPAA